MKTFSHGEFNSIEKDVKLKGPGILAWIDFDDVDHEETAAAGMAMVRVLNESIDRFNEIFAQEKAILYRKMWESEPELREEYPSFSDYFPDAKSGYSKGFAIEAGRHPLGYLISFECSCGGEIFHKEDTPAEINPWDDCPREILGEDFLLECSCGMIYRAVHHTENTYMVTVQ
jgi:hypothetical protein